MFSEGGKRREQFQRMQDMFRDPRMMENIFGDSKMEELTVKVVSMLMISGKTFDSLNQSKQGVGEIYKIQHGMGLLPEMKEKPRKSNEEALKLRTRGNQAYQAKDLMEALRLYTKAICCAEPEGEEIAKAYANRSAVTYWLKEYQNSIEDVNHALSSGKYPRNLTQKLFERRGKCFLALSQYKRATGDFKQAIVLLLETDTDTDQVNSLKAYVDLIAKCQGKQDTPMESARQPKLSHGPSSYIQSASAAVDMKYSSKMGRHVVASLDIAPGDILGIEKPYASVLDPEYQDLFCDNCKRKSHSAIPCVSCNEVVFCSELCRESSWATYHSLECDILHNLNDLGCTGAGMLGLRTLLKATKLGENLHMFMDDFLNESDDSCEPDKLGFVDNMYLSDHYKPAHNLITHIENRSPVELLRVAVTASILVHVLKEASTFFEHSDSSIPSAALFKPVSDLRWNHIVAADLLMRYIMVSACNSYRTQEVIWKREGDDVEFKLKAIGGATYSFHSLLNHSCDPDVHFCPFNGDTLIMFAVKPITKGQQIFCSYRFHYAEHDKLTRQSQLRSHFHFTCECTACHEDWPMILNMNEENPKFVSERAKKRFQCETAESFRYLPDIFMAAQQGKMTEKQFQFLTQHLTLIHKYVKQPWKICYICQQTIRRYMEFSFNPHQHTSITPLSN